MPPATPADYLNRVSESPLFLSRKESRYSRARWATCNGRAPSSSAPTMREKLEAINRRQQRVGGQVQLIKPGSWAFVLRRACV